ncbi:MAG: DNA (cytosine-5-)-methyltransferase [Micromonosporaceae bacterium]|nr:DNA (cytosine-5-)-methyltransferase [Micromonosporaceae bacterium]
MRLGSLCTGYGGLDLGAELALGPLEHAWHAEIDPDASRVLAAHWPDVPNLGDLTAVDWARVEPVDVLTAGFPCQPVSSAGQRKGVDDERWLWDDIAAAIGRMDPRPRLLVLENVLGLLTANRGHAMARVICGLAALGYVGRYRVVSAADVGAAHRRERVFVVAWPAADPPRLGYRDTGAASVRGIQAAAVAGSTDAGELTLLPTPNAAQGRGTGTPSRETAERRMYVEGRRFLDDAVALLPTPRASDGAHGGPNQRGSSGGLMLPSAVMLLPTPTAMDAHSARNATSGRKQDSKHHDGWTLGDVAYADRWGQYAPAIARWEQVTGRSAPDPTEPGTKGQPRLSPRFVEWLMGLEPGWVTDHLPRNPALRVLGNGVVPQQAAAAIRELVSA